MSLAPEWIMCGVNRYVFVHNEQIVGEITMLTDWWAMLEIHTPDRIGRFTTKPAAMRAVELAYDAWRRGDLLR